MSGRGLSDERGMAMVNTGELGAGTQCSGPDAETQVWSKLAEKTALPQAGQSVVAHFLATQGTWMQKAAFYTREGLRGQ
jgi:hypothetical protein